MMLKPGENGDVSAHQTAYIDEVVSSAGVERSAKLPCTGTFHGQPDIEKCDVGTFRSIPMKVM